MTTYEYIIVMLAFAVFLGGTVYLLAIVVDVLAEALDDKELAERGQGRTAKDSGLAGDAADASGAWGKK